MKQFSRDSKLFLKIPITWKIYFRSIAENFTIQMAVGY